MPRQKLLLVLIDGIGDVGVPSLDGKTPLQAAHTPSMDSLAANGLNGLMDPFQPGLACGSDTAHMSILGYNPRIHYQGRGAFETMGAGLPMTPGDIAFKSNFAYLDRTSGIVVSRRADRHFEGLGPDLCDAMNDVRLPSFPHHSVAVKYATEHRCAVRVSGPGLTDAITGTDPLKDNLPLVTCTPLDDSEAARMTSQLVNELSDVFYDKLIHHPINLEREKAGKNPANCILLRGCGRCIDVPSVETLHGWKSFMIAPTCIVAGLGMTVGMDLVPVDGATGDYHSDLLAKSRRAVECLATDQYDFGFVHVKAVDHAGHDKNVTQKVRFLEKSDAMIGDMVQRLENQNKDAEYFVLVTSDHSTPVLYGDHSCEPVPFVISRIGTPSICDSVDQFDEIQAARGDLGRFCGDQVMRIAKWYMNHATGAQCRT